MRARVRVWLGEGVSFVGTSRALRAPLAPTWNDDDLMPRRGPTVATTAPMYSAAVRRDPPNSPRPRRLMPHGRVGALPFMIGTVMVKKGKRAA